MCTGSPNPEEEGPHSGAWREGGERKSENIKGERLNSVFVRYYQINMAGHGVATELAVLTLVCGDLPTVLSWCCG